MRKILASVNGVRKKFQARFVRFGKKTNFHSYSDQTVLLQNVTDGETGAVIADHVWFTYTKGFEKTNLVPGVSIAFEARVRSYKKGYVNRKYGIDDRIVDYKLSHPTRIRVIGDCSPKVDPSER